MFEALKIYLHKTKHSDRYQILPALLQQQALTQDELLRRQIQDRAYILNFAIKRTKYYNERYAGLLPENLNQLDFKSLPILSKTEIVNNLDAMLSDTADRNTVRRGYTGGSTGKPLTFYYDTHKMELMRAGMCRSYMWSGWRPGDKILNFWGAKQDIKQRNLRSY
ncbi:MAG TPA: hypothetical protein ENI98_08970, partial [Gammaproteobacteria bacterium]|nr:hypothetical protein [Gammaproteobacteria bacterium]